MKRARALQPLSRDHLKALLAAKKLGEAGDSQTGARAFLSFWASEQHHFRVEEEILLPSWAAHAEIDNAAVLRTLEDHLAIRAAALRIAESRLTLPEMHRLAGRLSDHVRFEERELFPLIEQSLDRDALERLGAAIAAAEAP
jgi:hemerythrin-like domain-containing protein